MSKYSDQRLGKDIIEHYKQFKQDKAKYKKTIVKDTTGGKFDFNVPDHYEMLEIRNFLFFSV
jgi:hypothetical protein